MGMRSTLAINGHPISIALPVFSPGCHAFILTSIVAQAYSGVKLDRVLFIIVLGLRRYRLRFSTGQQSI